MVKKHPHIETTETNVKESPLGKILFITDQHNTQKGPTHVKKKCKSSHGQPPPRTPTPPLVPSSPASEKSVEGSDQEHLLDYEGLLADFNIEMLAEDDRDATPTPAAPLKAQPSSSAPTVKTAGNSAQASSSVPMGKAPGSSKVSKPGKSQDLAESTHAPTKGDSTLKLPPTHQPPLVKKPALQVKTMEGLEVCLAACQQVIKELEQQNPWVFQPKPGGLAWPPKGCMLDPFAPHQTVKEFNLKVIPSTKDIIWAILGNLGPPKGQFCQAAAQAFLVEKLEKADAKVKILAKAAFWSLLQLLTPESASALVKQQYPQPVQYVYTLIGKPGILELKRMFTKDPEAAFALVRQKIAEMFHIPGEMIEQVLDFDTKNLEKIRIWICLIDPEACQDPKGIPNELADWLITWKATWGQRRSIITVSSSLTIDIHMAYPCNLCHSGDHQEPGCPWAQRGFLLEGRCLQATVKREGQGESSK
ncbi:hypothetical protein PISMIDRAFT_24203 [Pisolithus microcarpus 441]|uniref:Uncharacterized protein n=1 Tax=Pisolithus microcarpus 441 TaxID=765257 RepID=A0A0C9Y705_9AGAM|nr:hypothetical protein PISMIDRAFT_24203 [Pisolithus microcarpus 441]